LNIPNDPFIRELLAEFVDSWIEDLDTKFLQLIDENNSADFYRLAHTLKGSCFQFGLDELGNMGIELMALSKNNEWDKCKTYFEPLKTGFQEVKVIASGF